MRSYKKGLFTISNVNNQFTTNREVYITKSMVGKFFYVHNGKQFIMVKIKSSMLGKKLGDFSFTRKIYQYKKGKKKK